MKAVVTFAVGVALLVVLSSCEGYRVVGGLQTDYGTVTVDPDGLVVIEVDQRSGK